MSPGEKVARNSRFAADSTSPRGVFDMAERDGKKPEYVKDGEAEDGAESDTPAKAETSAKGGLAGRAYDAAHYAIDKISECKKGEGSDALAWAKTAETLCKIAATAPASSGEGQAQAQAKTAGKGRGRGSALQPPPAKFPKGDDWKRDNPMYNSAGELEWPDLSDEFDGEHRYYGERADDGSKGEAQAETASAAKPNGKPH